MNPIATTTTHSLDFDIAAFYPFAHIEADPSIEGASVVEAMAIAETLDLTAAEWTAMIDGLRRDDAKTVRLEEEFDWIGAGLLLTVGQSKL